MESSKYIQNELRTFITKFPYTHVRYEYDKNSLVHLIEILPKDVYQSCDEYIHWEDIFSRNFVELFPCENVCFISTGDLIGINNPQMVLCGDNFLPFTSFSCHRSTDYSTKLIQGTIKHFDAITVSLCKERSTFEKVNVYDDIIDEINLAA